MFVCLLVCLFVCFFVCLFRLFCFVLFCLFVCFVLFCFVCLFRLFCCVLLYFNFLFGDSGKVPNLFPYLGPHWHQPRGIGPSGRRFAVHRSDISPRTSMVGPHTRVEVAPVSCVHPLLFDDIYHRYDSMESLECNSNI